MSALDAATPQPVAPRARAGCLFIAASALLCWLHVPLLSAADAAPSISDLKRMNVEDLMKVQVTSVARRPERVGDAPAAVHVITREQIRHSGAVTLVEALRLAPNLQVAQRGARGWAVSARGFNAELANKLLVMIDGRTVYSPLFSGVFWEAQGYLLEDIERIEVISGPGGTLWGANAVNGVISIITRDAADTHGLFLTAGAGNELDHVVGARYGAQIAPDMHLRVFGKHVDHDASALPDGSAANDAWRRLQGGFRLDGGSTDRFTLQGDVYRSRQDDPEADGHTHFRGANLLARWTRQTATNGNVRLQAYVDWAGFSDPMPALQLQGLELAPAGRMRDDMLTFDVDFQYRFQAGEDHALTWGAGFRHMHDDFDASPSLAFEPANWNQQLYSVFLQDEIRLGERTALTVGSKIEHNDDTGFEFEPSARLQWRAAPEHLLWAAVSRAIRAPSRIDRDVLQPAPPYPGLLYGNPQFRSEKLIAYEVGHRAALGSRASTSVALFFNEYDDVRSVTITPQTLLPFRIANDLTGHTYGLEFSTSVQVTDRWTLHAGYNLFEERMRVKPGRIDISNGQNETVDPEQQASLRSSLSLPRGFEIDAALRWVDILHNNNAAEIGTVPHYLELDARLAWRATPRLEVSLVGHNLLDDQHPEYGFPRPTRIEVQRSFFGRLTWRH